MDKVKIENGIITNEIPYFICPNEIFDKQIIITDYNDPSKKVRELDCHEMLIYIYLLRCCNGGKKAFPSYKYMASKCKCSKRKAMYAINNLFKNDFIIKKNKGYIPNNKHQVNKNYSNIYMINHAKLKEISI